MNQEIKNRTVKKIQQNQTAPNHNITINGRIYSVFPQVFSPAIFLGTEWLTNSVIKHLPNQSSVLEIGVGCGCTLVEMLMSKKFKHVSGVDINQHAVQNTLANLKAYNLQTDVYESDVLDNQQISSQIQIVYWNYPFHPSERDWNQLSLIQKSVMDPSYSHLIKLLEQSISRKVKQIYLGFSLTMGDIDKLKEILAQKQLKFEIVDRMDQLKGTICLIRIDLQ